MCLARETLRRPTATDLLGRPGPGLDRDDLMPVVHATRPAGAVGRLERAAIRTGAHRQRGDEMVSSAVAPPHSADLALWYCTHGLIPPLTRATLGPKRFAGSVPPARQRATPPRSPDRNGTAPRRGSGRIPRTSRDSPP